ncbi:galactose-1-phosphate uridylyltransferase [Streptacidiphilus sp. ASG 303]|uniref:galactose-1-phosphate uridylyltransferase n=1 Tax=Streptacidiphilus sp. ASG 303 TaxID=2896847 RepID=UPI001E4770FF|nr:galactose-1-phosphate uridylyltransferase [Streptacidiphilus sp. ASG 303]MCD0483936.1 galactose-1-phosphate uridylyltransferase [Streptacidiphilus sp. ASG 303]
MKKTTTKLADGRELIYYDADDSAVRDAADTQDPRPLEHVASLSEIRHDPVLDEWVAVASHRQGRIYHPPADECPLCPSRDGRHTEIPAADYQVAVFENRFPSLAADAAAHYEGDSGPGTARTTGPLPYLGRPGTGRCEVVCFTQEHDLSFADLTPAQARLVLDAWTDRTAELSAMPGVEQVFCFENRGAEIGVTLGHPHGQIYAYPFTTPRTERMLASAAAHRRRTGRNLFEDLLAAERAAPERVVVAGEHWTAFVPYAAHWPYEVHLYPNRRVSDLTALDEDQRAEFPGIYLDLLRRFDRLFVEDGQTAQASPTPYIAAWHQAPVRQSAAAGRPPAATELALHLELFTIRRTVGKLKFLAGSESGMDVFVNDVSPERAAQRLREVAP